MSKKSAEYKLDVEEAEKLIEYVHKELNFLEKTL